MPPNRIKITELYTDRTCIIRDTTEKNTYEGYLLDERNRVVEPDLDTLDYDKRIRVRLITGEILQTTPIVLRVVDKDDKLVEVTTRAGTRYAISIISIV